MCLRYSVMLVEGSAHLRRTFLEEVSRDFGGFEFIGVAENRAEALEKVEFSEPDIIVADLCGSYESALDFASEVRKIRPSAKVVVIGDRNGSYSEHISRNIIAFLKKPVSPERLSRVLGDIKKYLDEKINGILKVVTDGAEEIRRLYLSEFLLPLMLGSAEKMPDETQLVRRAKELAIIPFDTKKLRLCVTAAKFSDQGGKECTAPMHAGFINGIISKYMHCTTLFLYGRAVSLIAVEGTELSNALELPLRELVQNADRILGHKCTVGVSREFSMLSGCSEAYFQAVNARRYTSDGSGPVRFIDDQESKNMPAFEQVEKNVLKLEQLLKVGNIEGLTEFINSLYETDTPENADLLIVQIIAAVYGIVINTADKNDVLKLVASNPIFARITSCSSENVMKQELIALCKSAKELISHSRKRETEILCDRVIEIIDKRYADEGLSLTSVSNELSVSPNYLSALIKKTKHKNFITLVTERRMKAAYDMLLCSNMKVTEVSERCGYNDYHYFSGCFKKFYGQPPNQIRKSRSHGQKNT